MRPQKRAHNGVKGPWMPSYDRQGNGAHKMHKVWNAGAQSARQRIRHLKRLCKPVLDSKLPEDVEQMQRVIDFTEQQDLRELRVLFLVSEAIERADSAGIPWALAMCYIMDQLTNQRNAALTVEPPAALGDAETGAPADTRALGDEVHV